MSDCKITARIAVIEARIAKDTADLAELQGQLAAASLVNEVSQGWTVKFKVGRADTRREVEGEVLGRGLVKDVDSVRVSIGSGFDAELFTVKVSDLTGITAPGSAPEAEPVAEAEQATASASDDLLSEVLG